MPTKKANKNTVANSLRKLADGIEKETIAGFAIVYVTEKGIHTEFSVAQPNALPALAFGIFNTQREVTGHLAGATSRSFKKPSRPISSKKVSTKHVDKPVKKGAAK